MNTDGHRSEVPTHSIGSNPLPLGRIGERFFTEPTVLIVDDNVQYADLIEAFLLALPAKVLMANDGVEALEMVQQHHPDLILLDVMMPRMSGYGVCQKLKADAVTKDIPILVVTVLNESDDIRIARECGADGFLSKPFSRSELLTHVKRLLG